MNKVLKLLFIFIGGSLIILLLRNFISNQILKSFITINTSIVKSSHTDKEKIEIKFDSIINHQQNKSTLISVKKYYSQYQNCVKFIDSIVSEINSRKTSDDDLEITEKILSDKNTCDTMLAMLKSHIQLSEQYSHNDSILNDISNFKKDNYLNNKENWMLYNFHLTPAIAGETVLNYYKNKITFLTSETIEYIK